MIEVDGPFFCLRLANETMEGIRTKNNSPEDAYNQLFPQDGISVGAGVVYALFLLVVIVSIAVVCSYLKTLKQTTFLTTAW